MGKKLKAAVIFIILLLADQLTKLWAVKVLKPIGSIPAVSYTHLTLPTKA